MMNKNYADTLEAGLNHFGGDIKPEGVAVLVTMGYRAALEDALSAVRGIPVSEDVAKLPDSQGAAERARAVMRRIAEDKIESALRRMEKTRVALDIVA